MASCCGCWSAFVNELSGGRKRGRVYRRAKYNEREYSIEFENLIEEEDFYAPPQSAVSNTERELLAKGKYDELLRHQQKVHMEQDKMLRQQEEDARLEDEAFIQAKKEAAKVSKQALKKQAFDKNKIPDMKAFDTVEFSKWLSEENIDVTSPDFNIDDFDAFLEKMKAKSATAWKEDKKKEVNWQQTMSCGLEATKIADAALNALQPVELHAVESVPKPAEKNTPITTTAQVNNPRNIVANLSPYEAASNVSFALENSKAPAGTAEGEGINNTDDGLIFNGQAHTDIKFDQVINTISLDKNDKNSKDLPVNTERIFPAESQENDISVGKNFENNDEQKFKQETSSRDNYQEMDQKLNKKEELKTVSEKINDSRITDSVNKEYEEGYEKQTKNEVNVSAFDDDFDDDFEDAFVSSETTAGFEEMLV